MAGHNFLSYARSDAVDIVKKLHDDLEKHGFSTWLDIIDIVSGDWDYAIDEGLRSARTVLVIMTPGAVASFQVKSEWNDALNQYLPVIPLLFKTCQIPRILRVFNYVDFTENYERGFQQLVTVLETLGGRHLDYLKQTLRALELAQQESADPRRFRTKIEDLRNRINYWEAQHHDQGERISMDLQLYRQEVNKDSQVIQQKRVLRVVGQRPLDVIEFFKDRVKERGMVHQLLTDPKSRLVSIIGRGGIGKTAIARIILHNIEQSQWQQTKTGSPVHGIAYLSTTITDISWERIFASCSRMFDPETAAKLQRIWENGQLTLDEKISQLITACDDGLYILLLDNFEDMLNDQGEIVDEDLRLFVEKVLLSQTSLRILITSRIPLLLKRSLAAFDKQIHLRDGLPSGDAVQLLRDLDLNGNYGLYDALDTQLTDLVNMTHGVPRALESVVSILANDPFMDTNELLQEFFHREDVVRDLIEENYRRLDLPTRYVLQILSIFRRPVTQLAIEYLLAGFDTSIDVPTTLRRLINTHIINVDRTSKTVYLHPIDQDYAYSQIPDGPVQALLYSKRSLESRTADYYAQLKITQPTWHSVNEIQYHLREIEHRIRAEEYNKAAEVLLEISMEAADRGYANTMRGIYTAIAEKVSDKRLQMSIEKENALFGLRLGLLEEAARSARSAIELARELGEQSVVMRALSLLSATMRFLGYLDDAARYTEEAEHILHTSGDQAQNPELLFEAGLIAVYRKKYQQSIQYAHELAQPVFVSKSQAPLLYSVNLLSVNYLALNELGQALESTNQWIKLCREQNQRDALVYAYNTLGLVQASNGNPREALDAFTEGVELATEDANVRPEGMILHNLARLYRMLGHLDAALDYANRSVTRLKQVGAKYLVASEALVAALEAAKQHDFGIEIKALIQCAEIAKENPDLMDVLEILHYVEQLASREGYSDFSQQAQEIITSIQATRQL